MAGFILRRTLSSGDVSYAVRIRINGKEKQVGTFGRKRDAEACLRRVQGEIAAGTYGSRQDITFADFADLWLERVQVRPSTLRDYRCTTGKHLTPAFGERLLRDLSIEDIERLKVDLLLSGLSPRTVNKALVVLGTILRRAVVWSYIGENPVAHVQRAKENPREMDYLTPDEVRRLLDVCGGDLRVMVLTSVMTGLRQGELLALRWNDFDPGAGVLYVRRSYSPRHGFTAPKSAAGVRTVALAPQVVEALQEYRSDTALIFERDNKPWNPLTLLRYHFYPALKRAELRRVRWHDLRHTYCALMLATGENIKFIQNQLGHSSITTTLDRYGHLLPQVSEGTGERLGNLLWPDSLT
jgi:integrase